MWKSIKKGLSLIGQSLGVVIAAALTAATFIDILPEFTGWEAFLCGLGGLVMLFVTLIGIWGLGEDNKK